MWTKLASLLSCPLCRGDLDLAPFGQGSDSAPWNAWVDSGVLACKACRAWFPIVRAVPVMLPYSTGMHGEFATEHRRELSGRFPGFSAPKAKPARGEELVMRSFSTEWLHYDFDGVIWEMDYRDHEKRFLQEMRGYAPAKERAPRFLEIGCGLGLTTRMAQTNFAGEAIGVDLSEAAWRAAASNRENPNLHFVQASVFALPFQPQTFDTIYTRGVLHHTFSTREAFRALAPMCRPGGALYVWVYGPQSINDNLFRVLVYGSEVVLRFVLNRSPSWVSNAALTPLALGYVAFNRVRHWSNPSIKPYNFTRALHAARDRYTPEFAHRHSAEEVCGWFREAGFSDCEVVDWRDMPSADHDDYRRNTGVRGRRMPVLRQADNAVEASAAARPEGKQAVR
jgi:SAM-dependent methyltransferase/uncharacterized protein YbaR (Trm112 family)